MASETPEQPNQGTLLVDATCAPADVAYPTDLNLLNEARDKNRSASPNQGPKSLMP
ncbi:hypothetical protein [Paenibacillus phocaensis]|uniref:hypothetical protein n=1 Tax=Paenibacillus phocaensis TaxID=1776378 RepID=UPI000A8156E6